MFFMYPNWRNAYVFQKKEWRLEIKLESDLAYEEKPVQIIDSKDRVTRNRVIKFHKVMFPLFFQKLIQTSKNHI